MCVAIRAVSRWTVLEEFALALADRRVDFELEARRHNCDGLFRFGSGMVRLEPQREDFDGVLVLRARWRVIAMPDWEGLPGMHALYQLVHERGPRFIDEPLTLHVTRDGEAQPIVSRMPELTARDLEQMRLRQRGG